jgi:zinc finger protein
VKCPYCNSELLIFFEEREVNFFGKVLIYTLKCKNCDFKESDIYTLEIKEPKAYYLKVKGEEDLFAKIVRSNYGIVEIKELKAKLFPVNSKAFITNVEGFLNMIQEILIFQKKFATGKKLEKIEKILEKIEKMKNLKEEFTVIVKDITGISKIIGKNVKERKMRKNEVEKILKDLNLFIFEQRY